MFWCLIHWAGLGQQGFGSPKNVHRMCEEGGSRDAEKPYPLINACINEYFPDMAPKETLPRIKLVSKEGCPGSA